MSIIKIVLIVVSVYIALNIVLYCIQELIIFQSGKPLPKNYEFQINAEFEEVYLERPEDALLHGLLLRCPKPKGVILYFHGNRGNVNRWGEIVKFFIQFDHDILVMDYRGYGKSNGKRNEKLLHEDAMEAYSYLAEFYEKENIVIYGRSIGTGIATKLASEVESNSLILETPYMNFNDLMRNFLYMFPTHWLIKYDFRSDLFLKNVDSPVHIFHGTDDAIVPIESCLRLVASTDRTNINFTKIDGGKHNNLHSFEVYKAEIGRILN